VLLLMGSGSGISVFTKPFAFVAVCLAGGVLFRRRRTDAGLQAWAKHRFGPHVSAWWLAPMTHVRLRSTIHGSVLKAFPVLQNRRRWANPLVYAAKGCEGRAGAAGPHMSMAVVLGALAAQRWAPLLAAGSEPLPPQSRELRGRDRFQRPGSSPL